VNAVPATADGRRAHRDANDAGEDAIAGELVSHGNDSQSVEIDEQRNRRMRQKSLLQKD
jgi:hypothetical protein